MTRSHLSRTVLASVALLAACSGGTPEAGLINKTGSGIGICIDASSARSEKSLLAQPTEFGIDLVAIRGSAPVRILDVALSDGDGLRLVESSFVAGGAVGAGFVYGDTHATSFPASWAARRSMPGAVLQPIAPTSTAVPGAWSGQPVWGLVVGVVATRAEGGIAKGVRITYEWHGHRLTLRGVVSFGLRPSSALRCGQTRR